MAAGAFWTYEAVLDRLVEAMRLWWRSPGGGKWPFACDAPWHLMARRTRIAAGDLDGGFRGRELQLRLQAEDAERSRALEGRDERGPLSRDDVARRDEATEWLGFVPPSDRRLVILALVRLAAGDKHVPWLRLRPLLGVEFGADGLRKRFARAVAGIAARLNGRS
jgi:hypothetical protein